MEMIFKLFKELFTDCRPLVQKTDYALIRERDVHFNPDLERYLLDVNGIVFENEGIIPWFRSEQTFEQSKFTLCPVGGQFSISNYSLDHLYRGHAYRARHIYKTEPAGNGKVKILWVGQKGEWLNSYNRKELNIVTIPKGFQFKDRSQLSNSGTAKDGSSFYFIQKMNVGDSVRVTLS